MKAIRIGRCEGPSAYLRLLIREPRKPGGVELEAALDQRLAEACSMALIGAGA